MPSNITTEETLRQDGLSCVPLTSSILLAARVDDTSPEAEAWLQVAVEPLGQVLRRLEAGRAQANLTRTLAEMEAQQGPEEILDLILDHLFAQDSRTAQLSLLQVLRDADDQATGLRLNATTWDRAYDWQSLPPVFQRVIDSQRPADLLVEQQSAQGLGKALHAWLQVHNIQRIAAWPIVRDGSVSALLLIEFWQAAVLNETLQLNFDQIAKHLSMLDYVRQFQTEAQTTRAIADNLVLSSRMIATAAGYDDMVQAAAQTIARGKVAVALTLFDTALDAEMRPAGRALVAMAAAGEPVDGAESPLSALLPDNQKLDSLWRGQPVVFEDEFGVGFALVPEIYAHLVGDYDIVWLAAFGLRAGDQVLGTLEILHDGPHSLSSIEVDAFNTLADQIGVAVRNRQLLQQSDETLDETRLLHDMSQQLIVAQNSQDLLRVLRLIAPDAVQMVYSRLEYDSGSGLLADMIDQPLQSVPQSIAATLGTEGLLRLAVLVDELNDLRFVEDTSALAVEERKLLLSDDAQEQPGSMVIIPIQERGQLRDLVRVVFAQPRVFDDRLRRLYQAAHGQMEIVAQSLRLLQEARSSADMLGKQVSVLETLNQLSTAITVADNEEQLLSHSIEALVTTLGVDYGHVCVLDESGSGRIVAEYPAERIVGRSLTAGELLIKAGDSLRIVNDIHHSPLVPATRRAGLEQQGVQSMLLMPLVLQGDLLAYVRLDFRQPNRQFSGDMVDIAQTILGQMDVGLQNIRLLNESRRRSEQLQRVSGFVQALQHSLDMESVMKTALSESRHVIPVEWMQVLLYDIGLHNLREIALYALYRLSENHIALDSGPLLSLGERMPSTRAWKNQALLHVSDTSRASWELPPSADNIRSLLVAPMRSRTKQLGIICVGHTRPFAYSETDAIVFQQMTDQLSTAVENALLYDRNQREARDEALINNIAVRLQQQTQVEDMLYIVVNDLGQALGARRARIRLGTTALVQSSPDDAVQDSVE